MAKRTIIISFLISSLANLCSLGQSAPNIVTDNCTVGTYWERQGSIIFSNWCLSCYCVSGNLSVCVRIIRVFAQGCGTAAVGGIAVTPTAVPASTTTPITTTPVTTTAATTTTTAATTTTTAATTTTTTVATTTTTATATPMTTGGSTTPSTTTAGPPTTAVTTTRTTTVPAAG